jgi:hypothetical protein
MRANTIAEETVKMRISFLLATVLFARVPVLCAAQEPVPGTLKAANASIRYDHFRHITAVRELPDQSVLVLDVQSFGILRADFTKRSVINLMRSKSGGLEKISRDSTLNWDATERGWFLLVGTKSAGMLDVQTPSVAVSHAIYGADSMGRLLTVVPVNGRADSVIAIMVGFETGEQHAVTMLATPQVPIGDKRDAYPAGDQVALGFNGWIAVLRGNPYRLDWRSPEGAWIFGAEIPVQTAVVTPQEKEFVGNHVLHVNKKELDTHWRWLPFVPPWIAASGTLRITPDGKAIVLRTATRDTPELRYDVIGRDGIREGQLQLNRDERIVGFGERSVYVASIASDGTDVRLDRHPWP